LFWGGIRSALPVVVAVVLASSLGVVVVSLVVQGSALE
jgi:hypothetical protein